MKTNIPVCDVAGLLTIAERAIEYSDAEASVCAARKTFFNACAVWNQKMGISDYIQRGTPAYESREADTLTERHALQAAKEVRRNATRRLQTAVRLYRRGSCDE